MAKPVTAEPLVLTPPNLSVHDALRGKYQAPHYVLMFEVRDSTGFDSTRSADAMAISLYQTKGREVIGFEIKHARSDWLRELKQPDKAEEIGKFCDYFYLVTQDDSIARIDELPMPWGWMVVKGQRLKVMKKPERMQPRPLDRPMLCSLLYTLREHCQSETKKQIREEVDAGVKSHHSGQAWEIENLKKKMAELEKAVKDFEDASGVQIRSGWHDRPKIGAAVKRVLSDENILKKFRSDIEFALKRVETIQQELSRQFAALDGEVKQENLSL